MLFLLRKIRKSFFQPGKLRTYVAYALGEIVLIVVGILIAVQIGDWNEGRNNRQEERQILTRIALEMDAGLSEIAHYQPVFDQKEKELNHILEILRGTPVEDEAAFLQTFASSTDFSWTQVRFPSATFDEITSSGKMGLVRSVKLRNEIATLYRSLENAWRMIDVRRGDYPRIAYKLLLRGKGEIPKEGMSPEEVSRTVADILSSNLEQEVIFELNRNTSVIFVWEDHGERMKALKKLIQTELDG